MALSLYSLGLYQMSPFSALGMRVVQFKKLSLANSGVYGGWEKQFLNV